MRASLEDSMDNPELHWAGLMEEPASSGMDDMERCRVGWMKELTSSGMDDTEFHRRAAWIIASSGDSTDDTKLCRAA